MRANLTAMSLVIVVLAGSFALGADPAAIGRVNLKLAQYNAANKEMQGRDYRPASVSVYRGKGEDLYTAMWVRSGQLAWKEGFNRSATEMEADAKALQDEEFRPISFQALVVDGQPRYHLVWKKLEEELYYFRDRLSAETFKKFSSDYAQRDVFPTSICAYELRGQLNLIAIWEKTRPNSVEYEFGLTEAVLAQKSKAMAAKNFHPQFLSGYMSRGKPMFAAIWSQQEGVEVQAFPSLTEADWQKRSADLEKAGYDLMSLQGAVLSGKPRFSAVWRKVKDLPEEPAEPKKEKE